ncbi:hypothetical protein HYPSUDRAFT_47373 [Hypholoma sublateritium FD-334 SS-4]|uniref:Protein arginine methyltransferase NDUFAF7 n=1 Tax=Hypholoma sublateritium (strain FD-334 SS-4) TaxID=945553 RepID=A0A0D2P7W0_HYPSF|nr:hypothetical protein HYPSUDRAFT_47373 [Hypholoma sublateritium FD-334 SS-4]
MRANQKDLLTFDENPHVNVNWHDSLNEISPSPLEYTMLVAHEFFDALPIHMLQKTETGQWHEVLVASNAIPENRNSQQQTTTVEIDRPSHSSAEEAPAKKANLDSTETIQSIPATSTESFRYVLAPTPTPVSTVLGHSSLRFNQLSAGSMLEVCPTSFKVARKVGELLAKGKPGEEAPSMGGCGLIIDYGANHAFGNTLRAFQNHKIVNVFHEPGNSDLTANVDFAYLKEAMGDLVTIHGPMLQGDFLKNMGLPFRLQGLLRSAKSEERREELRGAAARLVDPVGMGKEYQVLGITGESLSADAPVWPFVPETPPAT